MMYVEFNSVTLFTVLYSRFLNCAKDVSKVTAQPTILELILLSYLRTIHTDIQYTSVTLSWRLVHTDSVKLETFDIYWISVLVMAITSTAYSNCMQTVIFYL